MVWVRLALWYVEVQRTSLECDCGRTRRFMHGTGRHNCFDFVDVMR
jgi:hypothetical protein